MPIREVERSGKRKNPRERRKKRKKARAERLEAGLKHHLDAIDIGAKLGAKIYGVKLSARQVTDTSASSPRPRRQNLWRRAKGPYFEIILSGVYL